MATCKDCVHYELCFEYDMMQIDNDNAEQCNYFKDASKLVELPCKLGDIVYSYDFHQRTPSPIIEGCVDEFIIDSVSKGKLIIVIKDEYNRRMATFNDSFGKTVFLTKEEAEQALREREHK